ncbi:MAG: diguanylate cyclase (GGDEF)-like protein/PAS domain S-box-containing protein [Sulfurimonas sp.]|jgi:diguanylate cyclase (GGDEF)-like protein/PAS domain S-box-containing protein|uniref:sensor domain-containing protein n=1 Tax=Sulfurimonas sp. TaxID=2022749 RepID=UPI0039E71F8B
MKHSFNVNNIPVCIAIYTYDEKQDDFIFVDFNTLAESTENIKREKVIGKYLLDVFPSAREFGIFELLKKVYYSGKTETYKTEYYKDSRISGWRENEISRLSNNSVMAVYLDKSLEKNLENQLSTLGTIVDNSFNEIYVFDSISFKFIYINKQAQHNLGYSLEEIVDLHPWNVKLEYDENNFTKYISSSEFKIFNTKHTRKDGSEYFVEAKVQKMMLNEQEQYVAIVTDLTEQKMYEDKVQLSKEVIESISEAVMITDLNTTIIDVNPAFLHLTGFKRDQVIGAKPKKFKSGKHSKEFYKNLWKQVLENGVYKGEIWDRKADGEVFLKDITITTVRGPGGLVKNYVAVFSDITLKKNHQEELQEIAYTDPLTQLTNRIQFKNILKHEVDIAIRNKSDGALLFLDLDMFKKVNDSYGHIVGDELLIAVAKRLKDLVRKSDTVSRIGGDEFTVVLASPIKKNSIQFIAQNIIDELSKPYTIENHEIVISSSIGIAFFTQEMQGIDSLVEAADLAMYKAKHKGRGKYQFFEPRMHNESVKKRTIELELKKALSDGSVIPYYQPKINPETGIVVGVEALARWNHPELGVLSPIYFLDIAEDSGLIHELGEQILNKAMQEIKELNESNYPELNVAVNLSSKQFEDERLVEKILDNVAKYNFNISNLELEITESLIMENVQRAIYMMEKLTEKKIKISIDDFGTGYSSLSYLKKFPISFLKIDKSFIDGIVNIKEDKIIVKTIMSMAESLDIGVIAEGIETIEQEDELHKLSCHLSQGYLYSEALSLEELKKFLIDWEQSKK